ncbi:peptidoglycan DD-metalloendopeptidase family protein [Corynebacterium provencense]|uniref:peptidoglycan DD-metalloendopeptidase family protein n=1 Tax=Corynebacterium provencense TaxID=1737425 RepID=UPI000831DD88|nr:peptidoglycan DD-metalloendopeptidase family protein [Corynebacterium provencense]
MVTHPMKPGTYTVSSGYGTRWGTFHAGLDLACAVGTPIYAAADGIVVQGKDRAQGSVSGFGSWIWIDCQESAGVDLIYGHVHHPGILVRAGDRVTAGQQIGVSGNEGQTTGPHLHFEVWGPPGRTGGQHRDPAAWLAGATPPGEKPSTTGGSMTIFGVDVSQWQDGMSLAQAKAEGMTFAIIRLCDGTYADPVFRSHLDDAETAGLLAATYWYLRAPSEGTTISQQVDVIDRQLGGRKDLGVWIDVESVNKETGEKTLTGADVRAARDELTRRGYRVPGIYTGAWYWERMPGGEPSMDGLGCLWVSNYGRNLVGPPKSLYAGDGGDNHPGWSYPLGDRKPDLLQFGSQAQVAGKSVDINAYRGTRTDLEALFSGIRHTAPSAPVAQISDSRRIELALDKLAGPEKEPDGTPSFTGWFDGMTLVEDVKQIKHDVSDIKAILQKLPTSQE